MKSDQMGTGHNNPSPRELPLSNQARFNSGLRAAVNSSRMLVHAPWARRYRTGIALVFGNQLRVEVGLPVAWDLQIELARVGDDRLAAVSVAAGARLLASEAVVHLGLQGALGELLLQVIEKAIRVKGRLGIGPSQELVQNGIRNTRLFASRHVGAP